MNKKKKHFLKEAADGAIVGFSMALIVSLLYTASAGIAWLLREPFSVRTFLFAEVAILVGFVVGGFIFGLLSPFAVTATRAAAVGACSLAPFLFTGLVMAGTSPKDAIGISIFTAVVIGGGIAYLGWRSSSP